MFISPSVVRTAISTKSSYKHASYLMDKKGSKFFLSCNSLEGHAEINVLTKFYKYVTLRGYTERRISRKLRTMTMVNVRFLSRGTDTGPSKPCLHCLNTLKQSGLRKIIYTDHHHVFTWDKVQTMQTSHITTYNRTANG